MSKYIIHNANGEIQRLLTCSVDHADANCGEGESLFDVSDPQYDALTNDITALFNGWDVLNGALVQRPAKPSDVHLWDAVARAWVLPFVGMEALQEWKWNQVKADRDAAEIAGFDTAYGRFDSDQTSLLKLSSAFMMANANPAFKVTWTLQDNTTVDLDAAKMIEVGGLAFKYVNDVHQKGVSIRAQIQTTTTFDELQSITWSSA